MAELVDKFHVKKGDVTEEITLYTTLDEVKNKGINFKKNDVKCYAAYDEAGNENASMLNCKLPDDETAYKVLKNVAAAAGKTIKLKAYRNDETFMQNLPSMILE